MAISHDANWVILDTDAHTHAELASYMQTNSLETVGAADIIFDTRGLDIRNGATLTSENVNYTFLGQNLGARFNSTTNFTNVIIRISGNAEVVQRVGGDLRCPGGNMNWTNSFYVVQAATQRADMFNSGTVGGVFNLNNVAIVHDGSGFCHLHNSTGNPNALFEGVTVEVDGGIVIKASDFTDCKFRFPNGGLFNDARGAGESFNTYTRLDWDALAWGFNRNPAGFKVVDPIKPSGWVRYNNSNTGNTATTTPHPGEGFEVFSHKLSLVDVSSSQVNDAKVRLINNTTTNVEYDVTTISGSIPDQEVVTYDGRSSASPRYVSYSDFKLLIFKYGLQPKIESRPFSTTGSPIDETVTMLAETSITESSKATVDAYTELETSNKAFDRSESFREDNFTESPIFTKSGDTLEASSLNVVIDATAAQPFSFDGTTVTLRATVFTGSITTTGTVSTSNGASINGGVIDSNGDSFLSFTSVDNWTVYPSIADRDVNTNVLETGTTGNYRFNFVASTTYYLRLVNNGVTFFREITPVQSGETNISLTTEALLASAATKEQIADQVWSEQTADHQITGSTGEALASGGGGGSSDWTDPEKEQIRDALGVDGTKNAATGGQLQNKSELTAAQVNTEVDTALADYDGPTKAELDTAEANIIAAIPAASTPLTAQEVTDAMKLAPSAGAADPNSIDDRQNTINEGVQKASLLIPHGDDL